MSKNREDEYEVGYKKPPAHTRFKNGQSGNPNGRPKGRKKGYGLKEAVSRALDARIALRENGRVRRMSKRDAWATKLVNDGLKGHHPSAKLVAALEQQPAVDAESDQLEILKATEEYKREFDSFLDEIAAKLVTDPDTSEPQNEKSAENSADAETPAGDHPDRPGYKEK